MPLEPAAALFLTAMERQCEIRSQVYDLKDHRRQHNHDEHDHSHHHAQRSRRYAADDSHSHSHSDGSAETVPPDRLSVNPLGRIGRGESLQLEKAFCFDSGEYDGEDAPGPDGRSQWPPTSGRDSPLPGGAREGGGGGRSDDEWVLRRPQPRPPPPTRRSTSVSSAWSDPGPAELLCDMATDAATVSAHMTVGTLAHCAVIASRPRVLQMLLQVRA